MDYIEISIRTNIDSGELLAMLQGGEALGAWESDGLVHIFWPEDRWNPDALTDLKSALGRLGVEDCENVLTIRAVPDQDWNAEWAKSLEPIQVGRRIRIRQSWHPPDSAFDGIELVIDPKRAFGTGYHATTQLVVEWLEDHLHRGERILDVGTGTGILAMVALRLGAASALAADIDPVAVECAREYCSCNGFGPELELRVASFEDLEPVGHDVVVANLDIRTMPGFCAHLPRLLKPGGVACLSGLQLQDFEEISRALAQVNLLIAARADREEWIALTVTDQKASRYFFIPSSSA